MPGIIAIESEHQQPYNYTGAVKSRHRTSEYASTLRPERLRDCAADDVC